MEEGCLQTLSSFQLRFRGNKYDPSHSTRQHMGLRDCLLANGSRVVPGRRTILPPQLDVGAGRHRIDLDRRSDCYIARVAATKQSPQFFLFVLFADAIRQRRSAGREVVRGSLCRRSRSCRTPTRSNPRARVPRLAAFATFRARSHSLHSTTRLHCRGARRQSRLASHHHGW